MFKIRLLPMARRCLSTTRPKFSNEVEKDPVKLIRVIPQPVAKAVQTVRFHFKKLYGPPLTKKAMEEAAKFRKVPKKLVSERSEPLIRVVHTGYKELPQVEYSNDLNKILEQRKTKARVIKIAKPKDS